MMNRSLKVTLKAWNAQSVSPLTSHTIQRKISPNMQFAKTMSLFSTSATTERVDQSINNANITDKKSDASDHGIVPPVEKKKIIWWVVSGLSKYSNRQDVLTITKKLEPIDLDCLLDRRSFPTGDWAIKFNLDNSAEKISEFFNQECGNWIKTYRSVDNTSIRNFPLARRAGVTSATICVRRVPLSVNADQLAYIFDRYYITGDDVRLVSKDGPNQDFLVTFRDPIDAQRASVEFATATVEGQQLDIHWYDI